ncbi:unnamed protein product [marine sediment metagenome]|uniref:Uncharacterized protein n=1 Tax=marine sediment metagenome TaxID=412755 RepID=X1QKD7_9ZZZZ
MIERLDIDKYLEALLKEYESFIKGRNADLDYCIEQNQESLLTKLTSEALLRTFRGSENEQLKLIEKFEKKITEKQEGINKEIEEKRKALILAIKKIRR